MATIKTAGGKIVTKVVNGVTRVSCSCCCFCRQYDLDLLLYGEGIDGITFHDQFDLLRGECGDLAAWDALQPDNRYTQKKACLRWLCRETSLIDGQPVTISNSVGGPTTNDRDLNDLLFECLGERSGFTGLVNGNNSFEPEEYGRCYLYGFEFFGWHLRRRIGEGGYDSDWVGSDLNYDIYRRDTAIPKE